MSDGSERLEDGKKREIRKSKVKKVKREREKRIRVVTKKGRDEKALTPTTVFLLNLGFCLWYLLSLSFREL